MTFPTNQKNTFKKDPLRGLEYKNAEHSPVPVVQIAFAVFLFLLIAVCVKMCNDQPREITIQELNSDRR